MDRPAAESQSDEGGGDKAKFAGVGLLAFALGCCGSGPVAISVAGGVGTAALLGAGVGLLGVFGLVGLAVVLVRARRRRICERPGIDLRSTPPPAPSDRSA